MYKDERINRAPSSANPFKKRGSSLYLAWEAYENWKKTRDVEQLELAYSKIKSVKNYNFVIAKRLREQVCSSYLSCFQEEEHKQADYAKKIIIIAKLCDHYLYLDKTQNALAYMSKASQAAVYIAREQDSLVDKVNFYRIALEWIEKAFEYKEYKRHFSVKAVNIYVELAEMYKSFDRYDAAIKYYEFCTRSKDEKILLWAHYGLIECNKALGECENSADTDEKWAKIGAAYQCLAEIHIKSEQFTKALAFYDRAIESFKKAGKNGLIVALEQLKLALVRHQAKHWNTLLSQIEDWDLESSRSASPLQVVGSPIPTSEGTASRASRGEGVNSPTSQLLSEGYGIFDQFRRDLQNCDFQSIQDNGFN